MKYLLSFALVLSSWLAVALNQATPVLAQNGQQQINRGLCAGANLQFTEGGANCQDATDATAKFNQIIRVIINLLSVVVGIVAVVMIIVGGLRYITSGGSDTSVTSAKNTILYAVIGLIIVALAQVLVRFVLRKITQ